jgi:hypothetical protein
MTLSLLAGAFSPLATHFMPKSADYSHSQDGGSEVEIRYSPDVVPPRELEKAVGIDGNTRDFTALAESELFELEFVRSTPKGLQRTAPTMKRKLNADDVPGTVSNGDGKESEQKKPTFASLGLDSRLLHAVNRVKFSAPTPVQTKAIPLALSGKDVLGMLCYTPLLIQSTVLTSLLQPAPKLAPARRPHTFSQSYTRFSRTAQLATKQTHPSKYLHSF